MLSVGKNILNGHDILNKVSIDYLYHAICNPKPNIKSQINQLRLVRNIDVKQYSNLKRQLPYIVCAIFNPTYRRTENFAYTEYFIIDIDHLSNKDLDLYQVKQQISKDERVLMCFVSPSEDGLKVLFKLKERCYDAGIYSLFYKVFLKDFSIKYKLEQVVDSKVSDVCRACFISIDDNTYYNPNASLVNLEDYLPLDNSDLMFDLKQSVSKVEKTTVPLNESKNIDPDSETMIRIKSLLNLKAVKPKRTEPFVPEQLNEVIFDLNKYIEATGVIVQEITSIQYGKKLKFRMGFKQAEINLFYGKNGFTVVKSPRTGTSAELNELMFQLINSFIYTNL